MKIANKLKRKLIQIAAFGFTNSHIGNFMEGKANEARECSNEVHQKEKEQERVREPQRKRSYPER